jgi:hypothetical protein
MDINRLTQISDRVTTRRLAVLGDTEVEAKENVQLLLVKYYFDQGKRARRTKLFLRMMNPWKCRSRRSLMSYMISSYVFCVVFVWP